MEQFINVFDDEARKLLLSNGFTELYNDDENHRYIFEYSESNKEAVKKLLKKYSFFFSNTLIF